MSALYFLGARLLGSSQRPARFSDSQIETRSTAFLCETCGEVWGRLIPFEHAHWTSQMRSCAKHGGGSFLASWRRTFEELPPEVIAYECHLLLNKESI